MGAKSMTRQEVGYIYDHKTKIILQAVVILVLHKLKVFLIHYNVQIYNIMHQIIVRSLEIKHSG